MSAHDRPTATPVWKKLAMSLVAFVLFFGLLEGVLALAGVRPTSATGDPYLGFSSWSPLFVADSQHPGSMVTAPNKLRLFNRQRFPREKPDGVRRVFCVGGSTTYGRPYDDATSFCGWLRELLPAADPRSEWELVNAGGISYASYRVATVMEELASYEPDLFIVYSGHNEFLEQRTYSEIIDMPPALRGVGALVAHTRTHAALSRLLGRGGGFASTATVEHPENLLGEEVVTKLDDSVGPDAYTRDDELAQRVLEHFRFNLARMIQIATDAGAQVVLVAPASNLRDCTPFKSEHSAALTSRGLELWQQRVAAARRAMAARDATDAIAQLDEAVALDQRFAHVHYLRGQVLDALGRHAEAELAYERARDEDVCPLRALGPTREIVAEVAADRGAVFVDFPVAVSQHSRDGIAGSDLFLDHVHPTIGGNRLLALTIMGAMEKAGILEFAPAWTVEAVTAVARRVEGRVDARDHALALMKLSKVLGWAGKLNEAYGLAERAVAMEPNDVGIQYQAGLTADLTGREDAAIRHYRRALEIDPESDLPHGNLAVALERRGDLRAAVEHYRLAYRYSSESTRRHNLENLAMGLAKLGALDLRADRVKRGLESLEEAQRLLPGHPTILQYLGEARLVAGDDEGAVAAFEQAVAAAPDVAALHNRLAILLVRVGRFDEAVERYRRALTLDPDLDQRGESLRNQLRRHGAQSELERLEASLDS